MKELFIMRDYNDERGEYIEYYLTDNAQKCQEIADFVDKKWQEAQEKDEWFDYFIEFENECFKNGVKIEKFADIEHHEY